VLANLRALLAVDPGKYVKGAMADHIEHMWHHAIKDSHNGDVMRVKVGLSGKYPVRCWDKDRNPIDMPSDLGGALVVPLVSARQVWLNTSNVGVMWECTDLMIIATRTPASCPWV
jgi:hypothetical protein